MALKINEKAKKILNIVFTSLEVLVVILLLLFSIITIQSSSTKDKTSSVFGISTFTVLTDSMKPEFESGDMIFAKKLDANGKKSLNVDDVICFWDSIDVNDDGIPETVVNTHRIKQVLTVGEEYNGMSYPEIAYVTKGDNNDNYDPVPVLSSSVIAKYSFHIDNIGGWVNAAKQGNRYFFIIVLPLLVLFIWNGYYVIKLVVDRQKEKALANASALSQEEKDKILEEAKRQAIEEYKKELMKNSEDANTRKELEDNSDKNNGTKE